MRGVVVMKKFIALALLSMAVGIAQADAPTMIYVTGNLNSDFIMNNSNWGYQFNNETGKNMIFSVSIDKTAPYGAHVECFHGMNPIEEFDIQPGQAAQSCKTNDTVRLVALQNGQTITGHYNVTVY